MRKMLIIPLLVLIVEFGQQTAGLSIPIISDIQDIIGLAHDVGDIASGNVPLVGLFTGKKDPTQVKLDGLSKQIEELSSTFNLKLDNALSQILTNVPRETDFRIRMNQMGGYMARISSLFKMYQRISKSSSKFNQYSVEQFVETATSMHDGDVMETLNQMHRLFTGSQDDDTQGSLISVAAPVYANMDPSTLCGRTKSRQQRVYDLYRTVVITEVKGFLMTAYAYGLLGIFRSTTFHEEIRRAEENLITRTSDYLRVTKEGLGSVPRDVYVCDPAKHRYDKTFVDFSRAIQLIVVHEEQVGTDYRDHKSCDNRCSAIDVAKYYYDYYDKSNEPRTRCAGRMTECRDLDETNICELENTISQSIERLVYVNSRSLGEFGDSKRCVSAKKSHLISWLSGVYYCEPCMCMCVEESKTSTAVRTFSLRPQVTDVENNMVLTGICFESLDDIIHLHIEQGKLIADGRIEEGSQKWVMLDEFEFRSDLGNYEGGFDLWINRTRREAVEKEDYVFIDYERRKIHLDDITSFSRDYVVTGAKLKISKRDENAIALSIRLTMFNFTTGKLMATKNEFGPGTWDKGNGKINSVWRDEEYIRSQKRRGDRTVIDVKNKLDPSKSYDHFPSSEDNSEISITHSSDREDVGQSTIPKLDRMRSGPMPRVALDGLGLYHRSNGETGGFIGIKTFTHDLSHYLNPEIDPNSLRSNELEDLQELDDGQELE